MASHKFASKSTPSRGLIPKPHYLPHPWTRLIYDAERHPDPIRRFPQCTGRTDRPTDRSTHRSRESLTTIGCYAPRATRPNNGHGHRQLWTKYVVHIMLHENAHKKRIHSENCLKCTENRKHDKYSDNGKYKPISSNNRPTREPG